MNIFKAYRRNDDLIVKGAPKVIGVADNGEDIVIRVARAHESNEVFQNEVQDIIEKNRRKLDALSRTDKKASDKLRSDYVLQAFVYTCIKGWDNLADEAGADLPYTEESLQKLAALPELIEDLFKFASDDKNYVGDFSEKEALKN